MFLIMLFGVEDFLVVDMFVVFGVSELLFVERMFVWDKVFWDVGVVMSVLLRCVEEVEDLLVEFGLVVCFKVEGCVSFVLFV